MKTIYEKTSKKWLSDDIYEGGAVLSRVLVEKWRDDHTPDYCDAGIDIRDCSRQISLDFSFGDFKSYQERLNKIILLADEIDKVKMGMMDAAALLCDAWKAKEEGKAVDDE